jgi:hypothetical protein
MSMEEENQRRAAQRAGGAAATAPAPGGAATRDVTMGDEDADIAEALRLSLMEVRARRGSLSFSIALCLSLL